ncbi:hypothetical protein Q0Z83_065360 [Actinoplanes sichuanensis]|uniref:Uncharacterized protein n=1 Tax=Actinoplanes sichuanensis TaxID=512349 RepID=A0ABW4APG6_9ACTN|nr:hypothetical protein [Actinoplanes sichuanensis]BEL08345.1 hypothetical protein Q0Z83_065360 [Actinoplanes sichuanensis]
MIDHDDDLYARVRTEFDQVHMGESLDAITSRGRGVRRRRRTVAALGVAVLAAGVTAGLTLSRPAEPEHGLIQVAAWTVDSRQEDTVVFSIRQLVDADELNAALKKAGVPALVEFVKVPEEQKVVGCQNEKEGLPNMYDVMPHSNVPAKPGEITWAVRRDLMPAGSALHFVIFEEINQETGEPGRMVRMGLFDGYPEPCKLFPPDYTIPK